MSELIQNRSFSEGSDTELDLQFKPIVTLPEVEVVTNEEDETALIKLRAKLYRFDTSSDPSEWKERGTGEVKILEHNENHSIRIVMRRDKTFKVCANHFVTPWMILKPCAGNEKAFLYTVAADFADEQPKSECLAIKFGSIENANSFKNKFEEAKEILLEKCCLYNGSEDQEDDDEESEDEEVTEKLKKLDIENDCDDVVDENKDTKEK